MNLLTVEKYFKPIIVAIIIIKLILSYMLPITSDEAYFFLWGAFPDINYYDHPPITGWIMTLFSYLGKDIFFSRLFTLLSGLAIAWAIYQLIKKTFHSPEKARLITLAFIASPLHVLSVMITTDTPLVFFTALSGFALFAALRHQSSGRIVWSGFLWGLAILSKYFAGLLFFGVLGYLVIQRPFRWFSAILLWLIGALPCIVFHLYANYLNCWTNVLFNVVNRNQSVSWELSGVLIFALFQIYLATPWLIYYLTKNIKEVWQDIRKRKIPFLCFFGIPILILAVVSLHQTGLHWTLAFYAFLFPLLVSIPVKHINRIVIFSLIFSLCHVVPIMTVLALPVETFKDYKYYHDLVLCKYGDALYRKMIATYGGDYALMTNGYYTSGAMTYHSGRHFGVFLDYSKHGRQDDKLTDFRKLNGKNILILATLPPDQDYTPYFQSIRQETITLRQKAFYVVIGKSFRYGAYRNQFLKKIDQAWYTCPNWLPEGQCYFKKMYFEKLN